MINGIIHSFLKMMSGKAVKFIKNRQHFYIPDWVIEENCLVLLVIGNNDYPSSLLPFLQALFNLWCTVHFNYWLISSLPSLNERSMRAGICDTFRTQRVYAYPKCDSQLQVMCSCQILTLVDQCVALMTMTLSGHYCACICAQLMWLS